MFVRTGVIRDELLIPDCFHFPDLRTDTLSTVLRE